MPLTWNEKNFHLLGMNYNLSLKLLRSNLNKLKIYPEKLALYDKVFREQAGSGMIEKVADVEKFIEEHPTCSFMPHMGVFRMNRDTTKCRLVFLS